MNRIDVTDKEGIKEITEWLSRGKVEPSNRRHSSLTQILLTAYACKQFRNLSRYCQTP